MAIVETEDRGPVRHVVLNRPEKRNAMNGELVQALGVALKAAANDPEVRCVVVRGEGAMFSSGMDFSDLVGLSQAPENLRAFRHEILQTWNLCEEMAKPTVCAIHGGCIGGALELALACDLRVAARGIPLGLPEAKIGMGANFGSVVLPKRIPMGIAMEMLLTGEYVTSEDAERWGLVNRITDDVLPVALQLAERIAANAPISVRRMKETAVKGLELPMWQALRLDVGPNPYLSEDRKEGIAAYLEKRPPRWTGR